MAQDTSAKPEKTELDWVKVREEPVVMQLAENPKDKLFRKIRENPFVPIGCAATVGALSYGLYNFYKGRTQMSQYMMRARVIAQSLTFVAIIAGLTFGVRKRNEVSTTKE